MSSEAKRYVVAIAGRTRAGKTTLATRLSGYTDWRWASFSNYIKAEAERRQLPKTRISLQDLGALMIERLGFPSFVEGMLDHAELETSVAPFIVEGVRHLGTLAALRETLAPVEVRFIYLDVSDQERNRRLAEEGVSAAEGEEWERHSTEREVVDGLAEEADPVIDADMPVDSVLNSAVNWLGLA
jgi:cytidylate kinase